MIIPWLRGFLGFQKAPITWAIILTNLFIFLMTYDSNFSKVSQFYADSRRFEMTAQLYSQYKGHAELLADQDKIIFGSQALKDVEFIQNAEKIQFQGDEIAIAKWKKEVVEFRDRLSFRQSSVFGFHYDDPRPINFVTYQFMHAGFLHLLSNMFMLLLFSAALETIAGGLVTIGVYLFGGIAGAYGFLLLGTTTLAPLVGASGSLSAVMAFYAVIEQKKRIQFFYFLSPIEGYYGWLWLPTWMIFIFSFVSDFAAYFGTAAELGSNVAYAAHIGGMIFGILAAFLYRHLNIPVKSFIDRFFISRS